MKKILTPAVMLIAISAPSAYAQTAEATLSGTVEQTLSISLTDAAVTFPTADAAAFDLEYAQASGGTLTHKGNVMHSVTVSTADINMTAAEVGANVGVARQDKPVTDVLVSTDGQNFTAVPETGSSAPVVSGAAAGDHLKTLSYRMALAWAQDTPGIYSLDVTYTIAAD